MRSLDRRELLEGAGRLVLGGALLPSLRWVEHWDDAVDPRLRELDRLLQGRVLARGETGYSAAKRLYNTRFDSMSPLAVAFCASTQDVQRAIRWARKHRIRVAARSGGHSFAGYSTTTGLVIDVSRLAGVRLSADGKSAVVGAGARLIDVYNALWTHHVAIPSGSCPTVAIGGLTQGGGVGFSSRRWGTTSDNLTAATVVAASGAALACSPRLRPDLFWALRGGGGGNFGVATSFRFRVHPVGDVATFTITWPWASAASVVAAWQDWALRTPDGLFSVCALSSVDQPGASPRVSASGQWFGSKASLETLLGPLVSAAAPAKKSVVMRSYIAAQRLWAGGCQGPASACLERATFAAKSDYARKRLSKAGIQALLHAIDASQADPTLRHGSILLDSYGGAINRIRPAATAFVHRDALFSLQYEALWDAADPPAVAQANIRWLRRLYAAMRPFASGFAYQNYIDPDLASWPHAYYGSNLARLRRVKRKYDPSNFFRFAQSVRPAP